MSETRPLCRRSKGRDELPSIFFATARERDITVLERHAGVRRNFSPSLVAGVSRRCAHGFPQVVLCKAMRGGEPFPTSFWLTCPYLERLAGQLESDGGTSRMEAHIASSRERTRCWRRYHLLHASLRLALAGQPRREFLRRRRPRIFSSLRGKGVGGISYIKGGIFVKCMHLQIASYLGTGYHPAYQWLNENAGTWECDGGECAGDVFHPSGS